MADQAISQLNPVEIIYDDDLFVLEQNGEAKKLSGTLLTRFIDRQVVDVRTHDLAAGASGYADYDRFTGVLHLYIPKGNGIVSANVDMNSEELILTWADGHSEPVGTIRGRTGKSAYDYAVENGYTGTEEDFAEIQIGFAESALQEEQRQINERQRQTNYADLVARTEAALESLGHATDRETVEIVNTTLKFYYDSFVVVDTTLRLVKN